MRSRPTRHTVVALLSAAGLMAGGGLAAAADISPMALPGTDEAGIQLALGKGLATVVVNDAGADATEVTGTFTNESDEMFLYCTGLNDAGPGTVTDAAGVTRSLAYMTSNLVPWYSDDRFVSAESGTVGSLGSLGASDPADELAAIQQGQDRSRLAGHYGTVDVSFVVEPGEEIPWAATLTVPTGDRTDFNAAALFTCRQVMLYEDEGSPGGYYWDYDDQWYAFAGYEESNDLDNGIGGSLSMGSLGS